MSILKLEDVGCHFGSIKAVDSVNIKVEQGEFVTLLGPSGCGKTTTLRMIAGLQRNTHGKISLNGRDVSDAERGFFLQPERRELGMVFQSYAIWPHMTVFQNVAYPLRIRRKPKDEIKRRVSDVLRLVEMDHLADRDSPMLSGGQQQRVAIARALVLEPAVLLLDEPLSNLDAKLRTQMGDEFRALQQRIGITTIYVTHDQDEAMALSDRIVVMSGGRVLQDDPPELVYNRPNHPVVAAFVGAPNFLKAKVESAVAAGEEFELQFVGEGFSGRCLAEDAIEPGVPIFVMIRPENLRVSEGAPRRDVDLVLHGQIRNATFRGARRSVRVDCGSVSVNFDAPSLTHVEDGSAITLEVPRGAAWGMRDVSGSAHKTAFLSSAAPQLAEAL